MSIRFGNLRSRRILYWECGQEGRIRARLQGWRSGWEMRGWWGQVKGYSLKASVAWKERWRLLGVWGQTWVDEDGKALSMLIGWGEEPLWKGKTESTEKREDNWESQVLEKVERQDQRHEKDWPWEVDGLGTISSEIGELFYSNLIPQAKVCRLTVSGIWLLLQSRYQTCC